MGTTKSYIAGFAVSVFLTLAAYYPVSMHLSSHHRAFSHASILLIVLLLAVLQLLVQLFFFLNVHRGEDKNWNIATLISTIGIIVLVAGGSLWIMYHLNDRMTPQEMNSYMLQQENIDQ